MRNLLKFSIIAALVTASLLLVSCGDDVKQIDKTNNSSKEQTQTPAAQNNYSSGGYVFEYSGVSVEMDAPASAIVEKLGDGYQYFESASCAFDGIDKTYIYPHFELMTYPDNGVDRVQALYIKDDLAATKEGLCIGSTLEDMQRLYGTSGEQSGNEYTFEKGGMLLKIQITDEKVSYITYASKVLGEVSN